MDEQGNSVFLKEMGTLWRYEADLELCWTNADRPGDKVRSFLHVIGTNEAPDKAKGAAWTYGLKYYFLNKFNIMQASGIDDPDMRGTEKEEMPKQEASVKPEKPKKKQEKAERKETAAKQEQTEPVREKKTDRKKLRDGNAISEGTVKVEYAVTDTEENLPGQMTFGMEESESGLEEFSDEETKAEDPVQTEEISVDEEITAATDADGFRAVEETDEVPFDEDDEISFDAEEEEETPEETAEETVEDIDNVEDAEDEVKWAEKVICNFGVSDPKKAAGALNWAVGEMSRRYQAFAKYNVRDMKGYNEKIKSLDVQTEEGEKLDPMPQIIIIVDELADLMMVAPGDVEEAICRLAQLARAAGIHLVLATQRPSVNVITGLIKANMPSRIAFSVSSGVDSRTIIDMNGAEKLLGKGDMLFYPSGYQKPARVQGSFVTDKEVQQVVEYLCEHNGDVTYNQEIETHMNTVPTGNPLGGAGGNDDNENDAYFADAGRLIIEKEKASIGMLQRAFKIGFNRAARIMDQLCEAGAVGPEEGTKPRKVLMSSEEFEQYLNEKNG